MDFWKYPEIFMDVSKVYQWTAMVVNIVVDQKTNVTFMKEIVIQTMIV